MKTEGLYAEPRYGRVGNRICTISEPWIVPDGDGERYTLTPLDGSQAFMCMRSGEFHSYSMEDCQAIRIALTPTPKQR